MTVDFLGLTDTDEVRASLGVDDTDIPDTLITNRRPEEDLDIDLLTWLPTYATIISEGNGASPTDAQTLKYKLLKLYAKYFISALIASTAITAILQKESDGSNEGARFNDAKALRELKTSAEGYAANAKSKLEQLVSPAESTTYSQFGTVSPSYDPVTNE
jgi:hypothetical protein